MGKYFGTDGFRGAANKTLTASHAYEIGRYLGYLFSKGGSVKAKIALGKDTRLSSYMLESAISSGLAASGADVYMLHVITTPGVSYVTRTEGFDCGIMITASHNVFSDNGIKILSSGGEKIDDETEVMIEKYIDGEIQKVPYATDEKIGKLIDYSAGRNRYIGYLISLAAHSYKGMNIGLDCANGSSWMIAGNIFKALGADTIVINNTPDGENINKNCGSTRIEGLVRLVREKRLDAGFAFDGDADRCIAVDEKGNIVDGDGMLYILGKHLKSINALTGDTVVVTTMSNSGFMKSMERENIKCEATEVGDRFIRFRMSEKGYMLGGESSGHIIIGKYANTGDGILTAIMIMEVMMAQKKSLSELTEGLKVYPQLTESVRVKNPSETVADKDILTLLNKLNNETLKEGRLLLRKSGTEPVVRIMAEAEDKKLCEDAISKMRSLMERKGMI